MDSFTCSTCLDEISIGMKMITNCSHQFHKDCAESWLMQSLTCSYCRQLVDWVDLFQKEGGKLVWTLLHRIPLEERGFEIEEDGSEDDGSDEEGTQDDSDEEEVVCAICSEVLDLDDLDPVTVTSCDGLNGCLAHIHIACMTNNEATAWRSESKWYCDYCTEIRRQDAETSQYEATQQASHHIQTLIMKCNRCQNRLDIEGEAFMTAAHCEEFDPNDESDIYVHVSCLSDQERTHWNENNH